MSIWLFVPKNLAETDEPILSVRLKLKISVTTEPIGFYSSGYISIGPLVVLSYFLVGWDTSNLQKMKFHPSKKIGGGGRVWFAAP